EAAGSGVEILEDALVGLVAPEQHHFRLRRVLVDGLQETADGIRGGIEDQQQDVDAGTRQAIESLLAAGEPAGDLQTPVPRQHPGEALAEELMGIDNRHSHGRFSSGSLCLVRTTRAIRGIRHPTPSSNPKRTSSLDTFSSSAREKLGAQG